MVIVPSMTGRMVRQSSTCGAHAASSRARRRVLVVRAEARADGSSCIDAPFEVPSKQQALVERCELGVDRRLCGWVADEGQAPAFMTGERGDLPVRGVVGAGALGEFAVLADRSALADHQGHEVPPT